MLDANYALYNLFVDVMHWHGNVFDTFRDHAIGEEVNAKLAVLVDPDGMTSIWHVPKLSHTKELYCLLRARKCYLDLRIGGTEGHTTLSLHLVIHYYAHKGDEYTREEYVCTLFTTMVSITKDCRCIHNFLLSKVWRIAVVADDIQTKH